MKPFEFQVDYVREQFPALRKSVNGLPAAFLDGPGELTVPLRVVEKINDYLLCRNANAHGVFKTSVESDALVVRAGRPLRISSTVIRRRSRSPGRRLPPPTISSWRWAWPASLSPAMRS